MAKELTNDIHAPWVSMAPKHEYTLMCLPFDIDNHKPRFVRLDIDGTETLDKSISEAIEAMTIMKNGEK